MPITPETFAAVESAVASVKQAGRWTQALEDEYLKTRSRIMQQRPDLIVGSTMRQAGIQTPDVAMEPGLGQQIQQGTFTPAAEVAPGTPGLGLAPETRATAARVAAGAEKNGFVRRTAIVDPSQVPGLPALNAEIETARQGYQRSQEQALQRQQATREAFQQRAPGQNMPVLGGLSAGVSQLGHDLLSVSARGVSAVMPFEGPKEFYDRIADDANRYGQEVAARNLPMNQPIAGAIQSFGTMLLTAPLGVPGMVAGAMASTGNQAITAGREAGLTGADLANYAATQGALEGAVSAAFQAVGLGGVEKTLAQSVASRTAGSFLKTFGKTAAGELPDELLTQVAQSVHQYLTGVDPRALDQDRLTTDLTTVALQTLLTSGFAAGLQTAQAPQATPEAPAASTAPPSTVITDPARLLPTPEAVDTRMAADAQAQAVQAQQRAQEALAAPTGQPRTFQVTEQGRAMTPEQATAREQAGQDMGASLKAASEQKLLPAGARFIAGEQGVVDRATPPGDRRQNIAGRTEVEQAATPEAQAAVIARLKAEARTDTMSGLGNKRAWDEGLQAAQTDADTTGVARPVVYVDLNHTKPANEDPAIRHTGVDAWVKNVLAPQLQAVAPDAQVIARHGGDEFGILLPPKTSRRKAAAVAATISQIKGLQIQGGLTLGPSAGVGMLKPGSTIESAITEADAAMAKAKKAGKEARGEETDSMKVRAGLQDRTAIAQKLGLTYDGAQENVPGKAPLHVFTDQQTGSTFMVPSTATEAGVAARVDAVRSKFSEAARATRRQSAVEAFRSPVPPTAGRVQTRLIPTTAVPTASPRAASPPPPTSRVGRQMRRVADALQAPIDTAMEWLSPDGVYKRPPEWVQGKQRVSAEDTVARERGVQWASRFEQTLKAANLNISDPETALHLHQTLTGERPDTQWAPEIRDLLGEWRAKQDAASTEYATALEEAGLTERAAVVRKNVGTYTKSVPAWTIEARGRVAQALKSFRSSLQHTTSLHKFRRDRWTVYDNRGRVQAKFDTEADAKAFRRDQDNAAQLRIAAPRTTEERAAEDVHDPRFLLLAGVGEAVHDTQILRLHADVAKTLAVAPPKGLPDAEHAAWAKENDLAKLPNYGRYHKLQDKYVPTRVAEDLTELVNMPSGLQALLEGYMRVWKKGVLVYNPATHGRNVISNTFFFSTLARTSPANPSNWKHYGNALETLLARGAAWEKAARLGVIGGDYHAAVIADLKRFAANPGNQSPGAVIAKLRQVDRAAGRVYSMEDDLFKVAAYLKYTTTGMSEDAAASEVKKWFPQHDRTSKLAKLMAKKWYGMPFASFFDQTVRIMARAAKERPVATLTMMALPGLMNFVSGLVAGVSDDEDKILRASQGGMEKYFTPYLPWRDAKGRPLTLDLRYIYPLANDILPTVSNHGAIRLPWLMSGPVPQTIVEQLSGRNLFTGKEFEGAGARAGAAVSNLAPVPSLVKSAPKRIAKSLGGSPTAEDAAYAIVGSVAGLNARQPYAAERDVLAAAAAAWEDGDTGLAQDILQTWNDKYRPDYLRPMTLNRVTAKIERDRKKEEQPSE